MILNVQRIANILLNVPVKEFGKSVNTGQSYMVMTLNGGLFYGAPDACIVCRLRILSSVGRKVNISRVVIKLP